jgi:hypothetical protein
MNIRWEGPLSKKASPILLHSYATNEMSDYAEND